MSNYLIDYEILNYSRLNERLNRIVSNPNNRFPVVRHDPIGYSSCGFPIEHFSIGDGPMHITYMGGAHGNEIISVDFVTQLMSNVALGNGEFFDFDPNLFTIDFIPCQNSEGFYTTTYALDSIMHDMSAEEVESFSKEYWKAFRQDDINYLGVNYIIQSFLNDYDLADEYNVIIGKFWHEYNSMDITPSLISDYLISCFPDYDSVIPTFVQNRWNFKFGELEVIEGEKQHQKMFDGVSIDCIPDIDSAHHKLREKLASLYGTGNFPKATLANFFANASGVNLNDNNEFFFVEFGRRMAEEGIIYAVSRYNNIIKSIPGPVGLPSRDMSGQFEYEPENIAILNYLEHLEAENQNYAFFNCHGTGGLLYVYPVWESDLDKAHSEGVDRDFVFYINGNIASSYERSIGDTYMEATGADTTYRVMPYPERVTGVGDVLRKTYIASFVLELSKMGGNPIAPYGDRQGNYMLTMTANMNALIDVMETIKQLSHLYDVGYHMEYDSEGRVHYHEVSRRR